MLCLSLTLRRKEEFVSLQALRRFRLQESGMREFVPLIPNLK
jgi:hypothetical protein